MQNFPLVHLIWAQAQHRAIGAANALPWHLPEDLNHFKEMTLGFPVLMGRRTYESLPRRPLPGRPNHVVTQNSHLVLGATGHTDLVAALSTLAVQGHSAIFVIGGGQLFAAALPFATHLHVTDIELVVPHADCFAPEIPPFFDCHAQTAWQLSSSGLRFRFSEWRRKLIKA